MNDLKRKERKEIIAQPCKNVVLSVGNVLKDFPKDFSFRPERKTGLLKTVLHIVRNVSVSLSIHEHKLYYNRTALNLHHSSLALLYLNFIKKKKICVIYFRYWNYYHYYYISAALTSVKQGHKGITL